MIELKVDLFTARFILAGMRLQMKLMKQTGVVAGDFRDMIDKLETLIQDMEKEDSHVVGVLVHRGGG